jgi:hypothetical protein
MNTTVIDHPEFVSDEWSSQREFLEDQLSARSQVDHVVLVGHHPLFLDTPGRTGRLLEPAHRAEVTDPRARPAGRGAVWLRRSLAQEPHRRRRRLHPGDLRSGRLPARQTTRRVSVLSTWART